MMLLINLVVWLGLAVILVSFLVSNEKKPKTSKYKKAVLKAALKKKARSKWKFPEESAGGGE